MTMLKYCNNCQCDVAASIIERNATYEFKGETFDIMERCVMCDCGEELYDENLDSITIEILKSLYEERVGLSLKDIKSIRESYGLSMDLFSRILGWSKATVVRYETGKYIPSSSHMSILKQLLKHPEDINDFYRHNKHKFTDKEQLKIEHALEEYDDIKVGVVLKNAINVNYKATERSIQSGYSKFSLDKMIQMILFFTQQTVPKTKLMKLLFYSDFLNFKRSLLSISGTPYEKLPYGPVPKDHDILLSSIEKNENIQIQYDQVNEYTYINISANEPFDDSIFTHEELDVMNFVKNEFSHFGSVAISEFSHREKGWLDTEYRGIITYDYSDELQLN